MIGIAREVAGKIPVVGLHVIFGTNIALVEGTARFGNVGNAVHHQHRREGQLRIARAKQFAAAAGKDFLVVEAGLFRRHENSNSPRNYADGCERLVQVQQKMKHKHG
jgi:hypothetical protein